MGFDSWVVMVTGAASGIALETSRRFIDGGATARRRWSMVVCRSLTPSA
ncbi:MAG: hypothetical protein AB9Q20_06780 [Candidatus Reddybacter sp.]